MLVYQRDIHFGHEKMPWCRLVPSKVGDGDDMAPGSMDVISSTFAVQRGWQLGFSCEISLQLFSKLGSFTLKFHHGRCTFSPGVCDRHFGSRFSNVQFYYRSSKSFFVKHVFLFSWHKSLWSFARDPFFGMLRHRQLAGSRTKETALWPWWPVMAWAQGWHGETLNGNVGKTW